MKNFIWMTLFSLMVLLGIQSDAYARGTETTATDKKKTARKTVSAKRTLSKKHRAKNRRVAVKRSVKARPSKRRSATIRVRRSKYKNTLAAKRVSYKKGLAKRRPAAPVIRFGSHPSELKAVAAYIYDVENSRPLYSKNADAALPIASLTKLMTAMVVVEAQQDMDEVLEVTREDIDTIKYTSSRLPIGARLSRSNMLHIALMSSENRAASALGRHYPGGLPAFVNAMNNKAKELGMRDTHYVEPTGLSPQNVSSAQDLAKLVMAATERPLIRQYSTHRHYAVNVGGPVLKYNNSNRLVSYSTWDITLQKTGYISEAGRCLIMQAEIKGRSIVMVFLGAQGKFARIADASTVRRWLEETKIPELADAESTTQG